MQMLRISPRFWLGIILAASLLAAARLSAQAQSGSDPKLVEGAYIYAQNCAVCHGPNGEGRAGATLAKDWPSIRPDLTVTTIIENGVPGSLMPAWSQAKGGPLSSEQIDSLVYYILSWQTGGVDLVTPAPTATRRPPIIPIPAVEGDPNLGALLYDQNCQMCHGPNGEGRVGATLAQDWPGIRPDLSIKTTIMDGVPGSLMPAWVQSNGGPLTESDINDLVAFVMSLPSAISPATPTAAPEAQPTWLSGWGGVLLFLLLLIVILVAAWLIQRRPQSG